MENLKTKEEVIYYLTGNISNLKHHLEEWKQLIPESQCHYIHRFDQQNVFYSCLDCQQSPFSCICEQCFKNGNHEGHRFRSFLSDGSCTCDCGNEQYWKADGFCNKHGHSFEGNIFDYLPNDLVDYPKRIVELFEYLAYFTDLDSLEATEYYWDALNELNDVNILFLIHLDTLKQTLPDDYESMIKIAFNEDITYFEYFLELLFFKNICGNMTKMSHVLMSFMSECLNLNLSINHIMFIVKNGILQNETNSVFIHNFFEQICMTQSLYDKLYQYLFIDGFYNEILSQIEVIYQNYLNPLKYSVEPIKNVYNVCWAMNEILKKSDDMNIDLFLHYIDVLAILSEDDPLYIKEDAYIEYDDRGYQSRWILTLVSSMNHLLDQITPEFAFKHFDRIHHHVMKYVKKSLQEVPVIQINKIRYHYRLVGKNQPINPTAFPLMVYGKLMVMMKESGKEVSIPRDDATLIVEKLLNSIVFKEQVKNDEWIRNGSISFYYSLTYVSVFSSDQYVFHLQLLQMMSKYVEVEFIYIQLLIQMRLFDIDSLVEQQRIQFENEKLQRQMKSQPIYFDMDKINRTVQLFEYNQKQQEEQIQQNEMKNKKLETSEMSSYSELYEDEEDEEVSEKIKSQENETIDELYESQDYSFNQSFEMNENSSEYDNTFDVNVNKTSNNSNGFNSLFQTQQQQNEQNVVYGITKLIQEYHKNNIQQSNMDDIDEYENEQKEEKEEEKEFIVIFTETLIDFIDKYLKTDEEREKQIHSVLFIILQIIRSNRFTYEKDVDHSILFSMLHFIASGVHSIMELSKLCESSEGSYEDIYDEICESRGQIKQKYLNKINPVFDLIGFEYRNNLMTEVLFSEKSIKPDRFFFDEYKVNPNDSIERWNENKKYLESPFFIQFVNLLKGKMNSEGIMSYLLMYLTDAKLFEVEIQNVDDELYSIGEYIAKNVKNIHGSKEKIENLGGKIFEGFSKQNTTKNDKNYHKQLQQRALLRFQQRRKSSRFEEIVNDFENEQKEEIIDDDDLCVICQTQKDSPLIRMCSMEYNTSVLLELQRGGSYKNHILSGTTCKHCAHLDCYLKLKKLKKNQCPICFKINNYFVPTSKYLEKEIPQNSQLLQSCLREYIIQLNKENQYQIFTFVLDTIMSIDISMRNGIEIPMHDKDIIKSIVLFARYGKKLYKDISRLKQRDNDSIDPFILYVYNRAMGRDVTECYIMQCDIILSMLKSYTERFESLEVFPLENDSSQLIPIDENEQLETIVCKYAENFERWIMIFESIMNENVQPMRVVQFIPQAQGTKETALLPYLSNQITFVELPELYNDLMTQYHSFLCPSCSTAVVNNLNELEFCMFCGKVICSKYDCQKKHSEECNYRSNIRFNFKMGGIIYQEQNKKKLLVVYENKCGDSFDFELNYDSKFYLNKGLFNTFKNAFFRGIIMSDGYLNSKMKNTYFN